jgi:hypothetical protein
LVSALLTVDRRPAARRVTGVVRGPWVGALDVCGGRPIDSGTRWGIYAIGRSGFQR